MHIEINPMTEDSSLLFNVEMKESSTHFISFDRLTDKNHNVSDRKPTLNEHTDRSHDQCNAYGSYDTLSHETASATSRLSKDNIIDDQTKYQTSLYAAKVDRPSYYRKKKNQKKRECPSVVRMLIGIPFALFYGASLYLILRFIFLDIPREPITSAWTNDTNAPLEDEIDTAFEMRTNYSDGHEYHVPHIQVAWGEDRPELIYGSLGFSVVLGTISVFSRGTRCSMLLMLPCLITGRSRAVLFTFIAGLIVDGPITSIVHNFNELSKNTVCVYEAVAKLAQSSLIRLNQVFQFIDNLRAHDPFQVDSDPRSTKLEDEETMGTTNFTFPRINALREQIAWMKEGVYDMEEVMSIVRRVLTGVSLIVMVCDAISYLRSYYSDNSFDNKYINRNVRHAWKCKNHPIILPLRNWEKNEGYKSSSEYTFKKREVKLFFRRSLPTVFFTFLAILVILADYLLSRVVASMKDEETIHIYLDGVNYGLGKAVKHILKYFHNKTKYCGVSPLHTSVNSYILICVFLMVAMISCIFEVLISRLRSRMCNIFYTDRAQERADYLHFRITAGRVNRRTQLVLTIKSYVEKEKRLKHFSPWARLKKLLRRKWNGNLKNTTIPCPGCEWDVKRTEAVTVTLNLGDTEKHLICKDCHQDYRPVSFHPNSHYFSETIKNPDEYYFNEEFEEEFMGEGLRPAQY